MSTSFLSLRTLTVAPALLLLALAAGCSKSDEPAKPASTPPAAATPADSTPAATPAATPAESAASTASSAASALTSAASNAVSQLGDLSSFNTIVASISDMVNKGDFPAAKAAVESLKSAWDAAAGLKSQLGGAWDVVNDAIAKVSTTLSAVTPNADEAKSALDGLMKAFSSLKQ